MGRVPRVGRPHCRQCKGEIAIVQPGLSLREFLRFPAAAVGTTANSLYQLFGMLADTVEQSGPPSTEPGVGSRAPILLPCPAPQRPGHQPGDVVVGVQERDRPGRPAGQQPCRRDLMGWVEGLEVAGKAARHSLGLTFPTVNRSAPRPPLGVAAAHSTATATVTVSIPRASRWATNAASWRPSSTSL